MLKKNSWIVALLLALSLTAFIIIGCVDPLKVEEDTDKYTEYELDKGYNVWAGQVYQLGWAIGGIVFQGKGDAITVAKDLGYDIEMFQKAKYLVIEMPDETYPRSGVDIIWGGEDANGDSTKGGGMWNQQPIAGGSGDVDKTFAKKDGNKLKIDLTKALKNYPMYKAATTTKVKIVMQVNAPSYGNVEGLIKKATLLIPEKEDPFVSINEDKPGKPGLSLKKNTMLWTNDLVLEAKFDPPDASNQMVVWSIKSFRPTGGSLVGLPDLNPSDKDSVEEYNEAKKALFKLVSWQQEEYTLDDSVWPNEIALRDIRDTIYIPAAKPGVLIVKAFVKNGRQDAAGKFQDYISGDLRITVADPEDFYFKLNGTDTKTVQYGAVDNGGVTGGDMVLEPAGADGKIRGYTITLGGGYGNSHHYVKIDLGTGKLSDYLGGGIKCNYKAVEGDSNLIGKTIRVRAMLTKPPRSYNIGPFLSSLKFSGDADVGVAAPQLLDFKLFKDDGGVYGTAGNDMPDPQTFNNTVLTGNSDFGNIKKASIVYIWFVPWSDGKGKIHKDDASETAKPTKFTITDIELYK